MMAKLIEFPAQKAEAPVSEDSVAAVVANEHGDSIRWCPQHGLWYVWDGAFWRPDEAGAVFEMCRSVCRIYSVQTGKDKWGKHATVYGVEKFCRTSAGLYVMDSDFDADTMMLGTPDGAVDLKTGELMPADRDLLITKAVAVAPAEIGSPPPELWLSFLSEATGGNDDLVDFLQRMCGYILTGETTEQCLFFLYGTGGNGKSVFLNTITGILGDYAKTAPMDTLNSSRMEKHSTDLAMLQGARLVASSETEEGRAWAEAKVKQMTGSDRITARFMRKDNFTYRPQFKLVIVGNHKPTINTVDDAIKRRFNIVPFILRPKVVDTRLEERLRDEWPGILRWMIDGCLKWREASLSRPSAVRVETASYFDDQDLLQQWLEDSCTTSPRQWEFGSKLYTSYRRFLEDAGEPRVGRKTFSQAIRNRGFLPDRRKIGGSTVRIVRGLYLSAEGPKAESTL